MDNLPHQKRTMIGVAGAVSEALWGALTLLDHSIDRRAAVERMLADDLDDVSSSDWELRGASPQSWPTKRIERAVWRTVDLLTGELQLRQKEVYERLYQTRKVSTEQPLPTLKDLAHARQIRLDLLITP